MTICKPSALCFLCCELKNIQSKEETACHALSSEQSFSVSAWDSEGRQPGGCSLEDTLLYVCNSTEETGPFPAPSLSFFSSLLLFLSSLSTFSLHTLSSFSSLPCSPSRLSSSLFLPPSSLFSSVSPFPFLFTSSFPPVLARVF